MMKYWLASLFILLSSCDLQTKYNPKVKTQNVPQKALPLLALQLKISEYEKYLNVLDQAQSQSTFLFENKHRVKAALKHSGSTYTVKLKPAGFTKAFYKKERPSLFLKVEGDQALWGMSRFVLHTPTPMLYRQAIASRIFRKMAIVAPRVHLVQLHLNGQDHGSKILMEYPSKEMLESMQKREGPLLKFAYVGHHNLAQALTGQDYAIAPIQNFRNKSLKSPGLRQALFHSLGLLRNLQSGNTNVDQVFNLQNMAQFVALSRIFGIEQGFETHQQHFYYNLFLKKLQPIAYVDPSLPFHRNSNFPEFLGVSKSKEFKSLYLKSLKKLHWQLSQGTLAKEILHEELAFRMGRQDFTIPYLNIQQLNGLALMLSKEPISEKKLGETSAKGGSKALISYYETEDKGFIQFIHQEPTPQKLNRIILADGEVSKEIVVEKKPIDAMSSLKGGFKIEVPRLKGVGLPYKVSINGKIEPVVFGGEAKPSKDQSIERLLSQFPFLVLGDQKLQIPEGVFKIHQDMVIPHGYSLYIDSGVKMLFAPDAKLVVNGALKGMGTENQPIYLGALTRRSFGGVKVVSHEPGLLTQLSYVTMENIHFPQDTGSGVTGAMSIYGQKVIMDHVTIKNADAEDALNIFNSNQIALSDLHIENTASDGLDCDFCQGTISKSYFSGIKGDAIDVSGSNLLITESTIEDVADKAVSVGEASRVVGRDLKIDRAGIGIANKDGSQTLLAYSLMQNIKDIAFASYIKKPEYLGKSCWLEVQAVELKNANKVTDKDEACNIIREGETYSYKQ